MPSVLSMAQFLTLESAKAKFLKSMATTLLDSLKKRFKGVFDHFAQGVCEHTHVSLVLIK